MFIDPKKKLQYVEGMLTVWDRVKQEQLQRLKPVRVDTNRNIRLVKLEAKQGPTT